MDVSPDDAAAQPLRSPHDKTVADLGETDVGTTIAVVDPSGRTTVGDLISRIILDDGRVTLLVRQAGEQFDTPVTLDGNHALTALDSERVEGEPPVSVAPVDLALIRELATVSDQLKANAGEEAALKARKAVLSQELLSAFELHGVASINVDRRRAYVFTVTFPVYRERPAEEGGGRYTAADAVAALHAIGRGAQVTPATVNHKTLGSILREYRDAGEPVPPALDRVVTLGEKPEVRVGASTRRK